MSRLERFADAYKMMAEFRYWPAAPSDGFRNIRVPLAELDLDIEANECAQPRPTARVASGSVVRTPLVTPWGA